MTDAEMKSYEAKYGNPGANHKKSAGPPPDYSTAAEQQSLQSHVNSNGPVGSSSWSQGPDGRWTQSQQFNGALGSAAQGYESQIANQGALDFSSLTPLNNGDQARQQAQDAAYGQATSRLDPQWAQRGEQMNSQLASQGLDPSSQAAQTEQSQFGRDRNDAYSSAQNFAVGQGQQAQQQAFGQSMSARQQQMAEMLRQRGMPMEQLQQLMGLLGSGQSVGAAQGANYLGAQQALGDYRLGDSEQANKAIGQGYQAAGTAIGAAASDERLKQNIERHPVDAVPGVPLATFEYKHEPGKKRMGVIAQDLEKVRPDLVKTGPDGIKRVPNLPPFAF